MSDEMICKACGHYGDPGKQTSGSFGVEVVLWLCFLIPGLIYSIWRLSTRKDICAKCGSPDLIPVDSPIGKKLFKEVAPEAAAVMAAPYRPKTGKRGGLAWRLGTMFSGTKK